MAECTVAPGGALGAAPTHALHQQDVLSHFPAPAAPAGVAGDAIRVEQEEEGVVGNAAPSSGVHASSHAADGASGDSGTSSPPAHTGAGGAGGDVVPAAHTAPGEVQGPPKRRRTGCRDITVYDTGEQIGEGTYGQVLRAKDSETGVQVAIKKVKMTGEHNGFPVTAVREIRALKALRCEQVVNLVEVCTSKPTNHNRLLGDVFMVFEYFDYDLAGLLRKHRGLGARHVQCYMLQLVTGLMVMHARGYLHRDLKSANLLLDKANRLVIADMGLTKCLPDVPPSQRKLTTKVCTLYYRAPEILLGCRNYDGRSDMWSAGLILAEMFTGDAILGGNTETKQLQLIIDLVGTPDADTMVELSKYGQFQIMKPFITSGRPRRVRERFMNKMPPAALDLLDKLLELNPTRRLTAEQAYMHPFMTSGGSMVVPSQLAPWTISAAHEWAVRNNKEAPAAPAPAAPGPPRGVKRRREDRASASPSVVSTASGTSASTLDRKRGPSSTRGGSASLSRSRSRPSSSSMFMQRSRSKPKARPTGRTGGPSPSPPPGAAQAAVMRTAAAAGALAAGPPKPASAGPPRPASRAAPAKPASAGPPRPASRAAPPKPASSGPPRPANRSAPPKPASTGPPRPANQGGPPRPSTAGGPPKPASTGAPAPAPLVSQKP